MYRQLGIFFEPESYLIGLKTVKNKLGILVEKPIYGVHLPLDKQLEVSFNIPGLYKEVVDYENFEETGRVLNVVQCQLWKKYKAKYPDRIIFPINAFYDDFTTGNALGSRTDSTKLGAVYISLPSLPVHLKSKLTNILISSIFYAHDRDIFGNKAVFSEFIRDVNKLSEHGLVINVNGSPIKIYFYCILILGDNLGLNQACGFYCSGGNNYCRRCRMPSALCQISTTENVKYLRTKENYDSDLKHYQMV